MNNKDSKEERETQIGNEMTSKGISSVKVSVLLARNSE